MVSSTSVFRFSWQVLHWYISWQFWLNTHLNLSAIRLIQDALKNNTKSSFSWDLCYSFYSSKELYSSPHWSLGTESILREMLEGMPGSCHICATFQFSSAVFFNVVLSDGVVSRSKETTRPSSCPSRPACPTPLFHDLVIYWSLCGSSIFGFASE